MTQASQSAGSENHAEAQPRVIMIGIDWADKSHAFHLLAPDGRELAGGFDQDPEEIEKTVCRWRKTCPGAALEIVVEQSRGALINALLKYDDITVFPINPAQSANYRKAFAHGGGKSDPVDARLLVQYLQHYRNELLPLRQDDPLTRELAALCEDRRGLVDQRTKLSNRLTAVLKCYFPCVLALGAAKPYAHFIIRFLLKYPTLAAAKIAGRMRLRKFFYGISDKAKAEERLDAIMAAVPLSEEEVLLRTSARRMTALALQIDQLNQVIKGYDKEIERLVKQHPDYAVVSSLPGASDKTHARMIAALGDDRDRWPNAESLQSASGIAPLTTQSGRQRFVSHRWACPKFMKQTFHEYAGLSRTKCKWAAAYYDLQISRKKSPHMAKRALAYKWQRIIHRCWQKGTPYDDKKYMERLRVTNSPLLEFLAD